MKPLRRTLALGAPLVLAAAAIRPAAAQEFPSRPVKIIVAYPPGTGSDLLVRNLSADLAKLLGQPVIVDNRAGAGGIIGTEAGARSPADGYTMTVATAGTLIITPTMTPNVPYNAEKDFVAVGGLARSAFVIVGANTPDAPKNFLELAERVARAGGANFSSPGVGTTTHLAGELMLQKAGIKATHVPYRGSAQSLGDVSSGQVLFGFDTVGATLPLVKAGRLRALAVSSATRAAALPDTQTLSESGVPGVRDFSLVGWWGLVVPSATPPEIVTRLSDAMLAVLDNPEVRKRLIAQEVEPFPISSRDLGDLIGKERPLWTEMVKQVNLAAKP